MSAKWFISQDDNVVGPLTTEDVKNRLEASEFAGTDMIWGQGMSQWQNLSWWLKELPGLSEIAPIEPVNETWHYALAGKSFGPFPRQALVKELKDLGAVKEVMLWTKGMREWAPLYEFHDLLTEIGVNKRQYPRADIPGKAVLKAGGTTLIAPLLTISEGGMGVRLDGGLVSGQTVTIEIQSPAFHEPLHMRGEVRYGSNGVMGLRFTNVTSEGRATIIQYVRKNQTRFVLKAA
jgi:hypothetical protein